jgi:hypothetical protein
MSPIEEFELWVEDHLPEHLRDACIERARALLRSEEESTIQFEDCRCCGWTQDQCVCGDPSAGVHSFYKGRDEAQALNQMERK